MRDCHTLTPDLSGDTVTFHSKTTAWLALLCSGLILAAGCSEQPTARQVPDRPEMLIYCGITMVHPIKEIANLLEDELGVRFVISQGGSEDLYQSLRTARKGDLYLPGSASYRRRHLDEGLLGDFVHVGYNQAALFVVKSNPLQLDGDVMHLTRTDLKVVIGDPQSGSIGRETKRILDEAGIYDRVRANAVYMTTDSRNLNYALHKGDVDVSINWRATAFFDENRDHVSVLDLPLELAKPKELLLNLLTFSAFPHKARRFMQFAESEEGQAIFRKHGFLDKQMQGQTS